MSTEKKGNKTTIPILALMVGGLVLGFIGLIKRDGDTIAASNFWNAMMIVGAVAFAGGFIWLNIIQPRNK